MTDARSNTKVYLDTYLNPANLTGDDFVVLAAGTADAGGSTTTMIDAARTEADDYWNGKVIKFLSGSNIDEHRLITNFVAATDTMTHDAFANAVAAGDTYELRDNIVIAQFHVCFEKPDYPMKRLLDNAEKDFDLVFTVGVPETSAMLDQEQNIYGYQERVPIKTFCVDKPLITGNLLKWKAEDELRRIVEAYPEGSYRTIDRTRENDVDLGGFVLYSAEYLMFYERDTT